MAKDREPLSWTQSKPWVLRTGRQTFDAADLYLLFALLALTVPASSHAIYVHLTGNGSV